MTRNTSSDGVTAFQWDIMAALLRLTDEGQALPNGLDIQRGIEAHFDIEVNHGRFYPNLGALVEMGFIHKTDGLTDREYNYFPTERGLRELEDRARWLSGAEVEVAQ